MPALDPKTSGAVAAAQPAARTLRLQPKPGAALEVDRAVLPGSAWIEKGWRTRASKYNM